MSAVLTVAYIGKWSRLAKGDRVPESDIKLLLLVNIRSRKFSQLSVIRVGRLTRD